jgi:hypothetical protein
MKTIFTFLIWACFTPLFAQQGEFHLNGQPIGSYLSVDSASASMDHFAFDLYVVNTGSTDITLSFYRERVAHAIGWTDQVCDCLICFNTTDTYLWTRPNSPTLTITAGDSCIFQPKVYPNSNNGCSIYKYVAEGQNHTFLDSISITYTIGGVNCFASVEKNNKPEFNVYPNPVSDILSVEISQNNSSIEIFDIAGKKVISESLVEGINLLDMNQLNSGIYFYSIKSSNTIIETKKLIVK